MSRTTIYVSPRLSKAIGASYPSTSRRLHNIADRYLWILHKAGVNKLFTTRELAAIAGHCKTVLFQSAEFAGAMLDEAVTQAIDEGAFLKQPGINPNDILDRIHNLDFVGQLALVEIVEQRMRKRMEK
jgi:hypothetical protein